MRARVFAVQGKAPAAQRFAFHLRGNTYEVDGPAWTPWWKFDKKAAAPLLRGSWPVLIPQELARAVDTTTIEIDLKVDESGEERKLTLDLFEPVFYLMAWRDAEGKPRVGTMAEYNRRYWKPLEGAAVPENQRPHKFPIADRLIGDGVKQTYQEGIAALAKAGFSTVMVPPSRSSLEILRKLNLRTAGAVYAPPGYAFDYSGSVTPQGIRTWAEQQAKPFLASGYRPQDVALFAMSDEPGWYYPPMLKSVSDSPAALNRFHEYLQAQGLKPADVGATEWSSVRPIGRSAAKDLAGKRLFYWSARFYPWDSSRHFAACSAELEKAFYHGFPAFTNWNFFAGRFYVPGPVANNPEKSSTDAAMGGHDWSEFAKTRGCPMLWTEDWFGDGLAWQWSFYAARMRSAAEKRGLSFGGYVVPRVAGDRPDGLLKKMLCVIGSGGKALTCYTFGPEYMFPGNCYSEKPNLLKQEAEANRMIGAAEELLWPGKRPQAKVAILWPRSSFAWDIKGPVHDTPIQDATNFSLNGSTVDYLCESFNQYCALQQANIPVDFVDEDDLAAGGLAKYRALYISEPDIPVEGQRAIAEWVRAGGALISASAAGSRDRYDEPCTVLSQRMGISEKPRDRMLIANTALLKPAGKVTRAAGDVEAFGPVGDMETPTGRAASFDSGRTAVVRKQVGKGWVTHFAWMPGISYAHALDQPNGMGSETAHRLRTLITEPATAAGVIPPVSVDHELIETPILVSRAGAAVTLLNWSEASLQAVHVTIRAPFTVESVASVNRGRLPFQRQNGGITLTMPLGAADVLLVRPQKAARSGRSASALIAAGPRQPGGPPKDGDAHR